MHQAEIGKELATRLQALRDTLAPPPPPVEITGEDEPNDVESEKLELEGPILDVADLPKAKADYEVSSITQSPWNSPNLSVSYLQGATQFPRQPLRAPKRTPIAPLIHLPVVPSHDLPTHPAVPNRPNSLHIKRNILYPESFVLPVAECEK